MRTQQATLTILLASCLFMACKPSSPPRAAPHRPTDPVGRIVGEGLIQCFNPKGQGRTDFCEASAVLYDGKRLLVASDKQIPGKQRSSLFTLEKVSNYRKSKPLWRVDRYLSGPKFRVPKKIEAMAVTPDGTTGLLCTSFDRGDNDAEAHNPFNTLMAWELDAPQNAYIIEGNPGTDDDDPRALRQQLVLALKSSIYPGGPTHLKVEGLAVIPERTILFGIREVGRSYSDVAYTIKIVGVSYRMVDNRIELQDDMTLLYTFDPSSRTELDHIVGLSSIEYDPHHDRLLLVTSYEEGEEPEKTLGAFLWTLPLDDFRAGRPPLLVRRDDGLPLMFDHKAEGITVLDSQLVLLVHDDDRSLGGREKPKRGKGRGGKAQNRNESMGGRRQANQSPYSIVELD